MIVTPYEESAQYILDEINKAGLKSPHAIYRLTKHLETLTWFAAKAEKHYRETYPHTHSHSHTHLSFFEIGKGERLECQWESREDPPGSGNHIAWCLTHLCAHPAISIYEIGHYPPISREQIEDLDP